MSAIAGLPGPTGLLTDQPLPLDPTKSVAGSQTQDPAPTPAPIIIPVGFGLSSITALGTSQPRSPEDTAALLAAITLALEETVKNTRENRIVGRTEGMRSSIGEALSAQNSMQALAEAIGAMRVELASATTQRDLKVEQRAQAQQQSATLGGQIRLVDGQIGSLDAQIAAAKQAGQPTAALVAQRDILQAQRTDLTSQKAQVDASIQKLGGEIATLTAKIGELNTSITASTAQYNALQAVVLFVFIQAALVLRGLATQDETITRADDRTVTATLDDVAERLREFANDAQVQDIMAEIRQETRLRQDGEERIAVTALALLTAITDVLATLASLDLPLDSVLGSAAAQSRGRVRVAV